MSPDSQDPCERGICGSGGTRGASTGEEDTGRSLGQSSLVSFRPEKDCLQIARLISGLTCIHKYTNTQIHTHTNTHMHTNTHTPHTQTYTKTHTSIYIHTNIYILTHTHTNIHTNILYTHTNINKHTHAYIIAFHSYKHSIIVITCF